MERKNRRLIAEIDEILDDGLGAEANPDRERTAEEREHRQRNPRDVEREYEQRDQQQLMQPALAWTISCRT